MNVPLLRMVQRHIVNNPHKVDMETWATVPGPDNCGATACIAGWLLILTNTMTAEELAASHGTPKPLYKAAELLGIDEGAADELFMLDRWPDSDMAQEYELGSAQTQALLVSERIDQFIEEYEAT